MNIEREKKMNGLEQRKMWLNAMDRIAGPVIFNLAEGKLKERLPLEFHGERRLYAPLEAFGRTATGIAPWLELEVTDPEEAKLQKRYREAMLAALDKATDPKSPDYMVWSEAPERQPLVDAAFLAHALVRAPKHIVGAMPETLKKQVVAAFKRTRSILPYHSNWIFFSAMVETALYILGEADWDSMRIEYALRMFEVWYKGDGLYGDGEYFHYDYYNSFVIHPMNLDICRIMVPEMEEARDAYGVLRERSSRYATILERMISPEGTYPVVGRSIAYRFGIFHALSQAALMHNLEEIVSPASVRCGLSAVIGRVMEAPDMFNEDGWLNPGVYGTQPELAETYINIGSLYLCCSVFLPLGLAEEDEFWSGEEEMWSGKKVWSGGHITIDHALEEKKAY